MAIKRSLELHEVRVATDAQQGSGTIVNYSSLGGLVGGAERETYHAAKRGCTKVEKASRDNLPSILEFQLPLQRNVARF